MRGHQPRAQGRWSRRLEAGQLWSYPQRVQRRPASAMAVIEAIAGASAGELSS